MKTSDGLPKVYNLRGRTVLLGALLLGAMVAGVVMIVRGPSKAMLWIVNPGDTTAVITIDDTPYRVEPRTTADVSVWGTGARTLRIERGDEAPEKLTVITKDQKEEVTLVDLGGDAAYAVMNVSTYYAREDGAQHGASPIDLVSSPARVHHLRYAATTLIRPGRPLPVPGSWELNAFAGTNEAPTMWKVFRVTPDRVEDRTELAVTLRQDLAHATDYENMTRPQQAEAIFLGGDR